PELLDLFIRDERYHLLVVALGLPCTGERAMHIARDVIDVAGKTDKPLVVLWMGSRLDPEGRPSEHDGFRMLEPSRVPVCSSPDTCYRAVRALVQYGRFRRRTSSASANAMQVVTRIDEPGARTLLGSLESSSPERSSVPHPLDSSSRSGRTAGSPASVLDEVQ